MLAATACLYAAFSAPEDGEATAFSGVFNKLAASLNGPRRFAHCALLFKVDSTQEIGFHTSIAWGGKVFCEPVPINIKDNTCILPRFGKMHCIPVSVPLDWDPTELMNAADSFVGMGYDKASAVLSAGPSWASRKRDTSSENGSIFCSEYCAHLLEKHAGVSLAGQSASSLCPNELYKLLTQ